MPRICPQNSFKNSPQILLVRIMENNQINFIHFNYSFCPSPTHSFILVRFTLQQITQRPSVTLSPSKVVQPLLKRVIIPCILIIVFLLWFVSLQLQIVMLFRTRITCLTTKRLDCVILYISQTVSNIYSGFQCLLYFQSVLLVWGRINMDKCFYLNFRNKCTFLQCLEWSIFLISQLWYSGFCLCIISFLFSFSQTGHNISNSWFYVCECSVRHKKGKLLL